MSCSIKVLLERGGLYYILVCIVVRLKVLGELLVPMVRTIVRVFLQMYRDCFEKRCVLMIEDLMFVFLPVLLEVLGTLLLGTDVGDVD